MNQKNSKQKEDIRKIIYGTLFLLNILFCLPFQLIGQNINIKYPRETLTERTKKIAKSGNLSISFDTRQTKEIIVPALEITENNPELALERSLSGTGFVLTKISHRTFVIIKSERMAADDAPQNIPQKQITGIVQDQKAEPIIGATVIVKGTTIATSTDENGYFILNASEGSILTVSFLGYIPENIYVDNRSDFLITLKNDDKLLNEVVVIGYGAQKKSDITGSVASVPRERLELVPNMNIAQALQGALSGMVVQQTVGGTEGEQTILLRGRKSILASSSPLIVLDGIPYYGNINDINLNDVTSLEVLKDASASAIYGSRSANGVILVTTKSGIKGKTKINYQVKLGSQDYVNLPDFLTGEEFYEFKSTRDANLLTDTEIKNYEAGTSTDWVRLTLRNGKSITHDLSVSGGNDISSFYVGGNYMDIKGLSITDDYQRISGRMNLDAQITDWLNFSTRSQFTYNDRGGYNIDYDAVFKMNPLIGPAYGEDGEVNLYPWAEYPLANPLEAKNIIDKDYSYQLVSNNSLNISIPFIRGLNYKINTGIRRSWENRKIYKGRNTVDGTANLGYANLSKYEFRNDVVENIVSYSNRFEKHSVFITGVYSYEMNDEYSEQLEAKQFPNDEFIFYGISQASTLESDNDYTRTVLISQMLRLNYSFDDRYLLTLTGRRDGFSGFGSKNKWGVFPSVALGWNISEERFFTMRNIVNQLKLRLSWGHSGNQAIDPYSSVTRMKERNTLTGSTPLVGYVPSVIGDENLGWESSNTINFGIDFGLYNSIIRGDLNLYKTNTSDLLLNRTISSIHGINNIAQNIGKTQTTGIEMTLSASPISTSQVNWKIEGNLAANKNKIVSLYGEVDENGKEIDDLANGWFIGKPISINYGYKMIGVWQLDEAEEAEKWKSKPGYIKIEDVDKNGKMDANDRQFIGQRDPQFNWGLSNSLTYMNFNLEVFFNGVHGVTKHNNLLRDNTANEITRNVLKKDWWTETNPTNKYWKNDKDAALMGGTGASIYENASFIRLKDVSLSYKFTKETLSKLKLERLQLFITGRNLMTITNWTGGDPELESSSSAGVVPLQREFTIGINIGF